ncbi:MAG: tetratricopeptide repeat protein [Cyanobacteria bacterium SZAS TMP-1]|nr:tetratricopeptide repeat protein [Cyanobacteria bacterium SZAS TMP-1]
MSEMHTIAPKRALTSLALSLGILGTFAVGGALADGEQSLQNLAVDSQRHLVVQFAGGGGAPQAPKLTEVKSPNHQLYIEFADTTLDDNSVPPSDQLTRKLVSQLPGLRRALIGVVPNAASPTVRVVLDLDPDLAITPAVANLREGAAIISLGDAVSGGAADGAVPVADNSAAGAPETPVSDIDSTSGSAPTPSPSSTSDPTAAYEEYYRKFLQQKQLTKATVPAGEWGPRKGTLSEVNAIKKQGIRIIGTPIQSPALQDVSEVKAAAPAPKAKRAPVPAPVAEVTEAAPAATPEPAQEAVSEAPAAAQPTTPVEEAPAPGKPVAVTETAPEETASQPAEAPAAPKEEAASTAQPDMVAGEEHAVEPAAPAPVRHQLPTPVKKAPVAKAAPSPGRRVAATAPAATAAGEESASTPADATAAAGGSDEEANLAETETPAAAESPKLRAAKLFNSALKNHMQGRVSQAITQYQQALKLNPELGCAHGNLGLAYNQMHNYDSALTEFHKALAVNPRDAITYNGIGAALRAEHDMPGAIKNWQTAVKLDPKMAVAHFNLGTAYELEGDPEQAMVSYQNAVANDPKFGEAFYRMGLIMQKRHRLQDAKTNFKKALNVSADSDYAADARLKIAAIDKVSK